MYADLDPALGRIEADLNPTLNPGFFFVERKKRKNPGYEVDLNLAPVQIRPYMQVALRIDYCKH